MGLLTFAGRIVLVVLNIIFILLSLTLVIGGFILRFAHETLRPIVKDVLDKINDASDDVYSTNINTDAFELGSVVSDIATVMIVLGLALLVLSFVGCCGACCNFTTIMLVYSIILIVILSAQVITIIICFGFPDEIKKRIRPAMRDSLDEYQGLRGSTINSLGWNWAMQEFSCCGPEDYTDFIGRGTWKTADGDGPNVITPTACCKTLPENSAGVATCAGNGTKTISDIAALNNYNKGCVDAVWKRVVEDNDDYYLTVVAICFAAQIALIIFACLVYKDRGISGGLV
ncbi:tetraspanin-9-like [Ruditapes philippinarum]|uniref:tetraspanin-9-like n=1 Tax=Ruditapes philippinarum TaxID=129788 RepID=UPI00295B3AAA|nr:tetraspanin-9-like [Ruditapes philippinarum]XP_060596325.1 tetraspanin-9-like [Ruditapes philippinarum]